MNKICSQCGAVLASKARVCHFCDHSDLAAFDDSSESTIGNLALHSNSNEEWRGELNQRLQAYRARRRKAHPNEAQTELPFDSRQSGAAIALRTEESRAVRPEPEEDFAFTIAIGRPPQKTEEDPRLVIDVTLPPLPEEGPTVPNSNDVCPSRLYPVASLFERRRSALIDGACLAFAYGGFLALFGSLGGQFSLTKLSAAICFSTFAFVYVQYFCLFTIFGGTTPGMMVRGLQVASFTGDPPTTRQLFWRAVGYLISAGTFFLGYFWALWDEDGLTWHDRLSRTYLAVPETYADAELPHATPAR